MGKHGESLRFGIVGCGRIGEVHIRRLQADGRARITALCDADPHAANRVRSERAVAVEVFTDLQELLDCTPLDAVIICTPTRFHFDQVRACRERGLHVLCEKPLADTHDRIVTLIEDCQPDGPVLSVAYQRRYWPTYRTLRREVQSGRWGSVRAVTSHNVENWQQTIAGTWRDDLQLNPGGFIGDAGSHKIDAIFYITGLKPLDVFAQTDRCGSRVEILATVSARLEGNVPLHMDFIGHAQYLAEDLHVHCEEADLMIRDGRLWIARNGRVEEFPDVEPVGLPDVNPVGPVSHWADRPPLEVSNLDSGFLDVLLKGAVNPAPPECALPVFDFTQAVLESSRTGRTVRVASGP